MSTRRPISQLLEQAHQGQEIIFAKEGRPYAGLVPLADNVAERRPGRLSGTVADAFFEPLPDDESSASDWLDSPAAGHSCSSRSKTDIDAALEHDRDAWDGEP